MTQGKRHYLPDDSPRFQRLPKYAQEYIRYLERVQQENRERIDRLQAGPEDSNVFADPILEEHIRPLGKDTLVRFGGPRFDDTFDVQMRDGELTVVGNGGYGITIKPAHTNNIQIGFRRTPL